MIDLDNDIQKIEYGAQVTFERKDGTEAIGSIDYYLGEGIYSVTDMCDGSERELSEENLTVTE